jgi:putative transposase
LLWSWLPRLWAEWQKVLIFVQPRSMVAWQHERFRKPPSLTWKAFLNNHVKDAAFMDFFVVPTVTYQVLFVLVILAHERRRIVHCNLTEHPTPAWTAQQGVDAFP